MRSPPTQRKFTPDAFHPTDKPFLELLLDAGHLTVDALLGALEDDLGVLWSGEEVNQIDHAILMDVARLKDIRRGQILLLGSAGYILLWMDGEIAPFILVHETAEHCRGVEFRPGDMVSKLL